MGGNMRLVQSTPCANLRCISMRGRTSIVVFLALWRLWSGRLSCCSNMSWLITQDKHTSMSHQMLIEYYSCCLKPRQLHVQELYLPCLDSLNMNNHSKRICIQTNNPPTYPGHHNNAIMSINLSMHKMWQHGSNNRLYKWHGWILALPKTTSLQLVVRCNSTSV